MTWFGFALVIVAAFCHAIWNFCVKRIKGGPELVWLFSALTVVIYLPLAAYVVLARPFPFGPWQAGFMAGSAALHIGYFLLLQRGYRSGDLSVVYPTARATGPVLAVGLAVVLLGERVTPQSAIGALAIVVGVLCLGGGLRRGGTSVPVSLIFGLGVGAFIGCYTVSDAYAVSRLMVSPILLDYVSGLSRALVLAPIAWRRRAVVRDQWRRHRGDVLMIAVFSALAYILVLYALTFTRVVYVAPTREASVLITVLIGTIVLKEGAAARRLLCAVLILIGIGVLAAA